MRLLLDTLALLWWFGGDERMPVPIRSLIHDNVDGVVVSAVSAFEISQKHRLGKLPSGARLARQFDKEIAIQGFVSLPISTAEARLAGVMPHAHRDPFDRLLIAQALLNDLTLVSNERLFDDFGIARLW